MADLVYGNCYLLTCVRQCSHGQNNGFSDELVTSAHHNVELREVSYSQFSSRKHGNVRNKTLFYLKYPLFKLLFILNVEEKYIYVYACFPSSIDHFIPKESFLTIKQKI